MLEGALNRLFAFASLVGREINLDMTQECLADILRASERKVTIEEIQRKVADHYNLRLSDLIGPKRVRTVARPRQVAMYLAKTADLANRCPRSAAASAAAITPRSCTACARSRS